MSRTLGILIVLVILGGLVRYVFHSQRAEAEHPDRPAAPPTSGRSAAEAIYEAAVLRFRPITMTTLTALLGSLPLALGVGPGSELRRPLGIAIVGGFLVSQLLTLYTTPVIFLFMERVRHAMSGTLPKYFGAPRGAT